MLRAGVFLDHSHGFKEYISCSGREPSQCIVTGKDFCQEWIQLITQNAQSFIPTASGSSNILNGPLKYSKNRCYRLSGLHRDINNAKSKSEFHFMVHTDSNTRVHRIKEHQDLLPLYKQSAME